MSGLWVWYRGGWVELMILPMNSQLPSNLQVCEHAPPSWAGGVGGAMCVGLGWDG